MASTERVIRRAVPRIVATLADHGVVDVKWFLAHAGHPVVWLATETDDQKAAAAARGCFREEVVAALTGSGLAPELAEPTLVTVESQEAVDRDFEGSWFYAMK